MFEAGISWDEALIMPLKDSLAIIEAYLDRKAFEQYRHSESVWAAIAPHSSSKIKPPELPKLE